MDDELLEGEPSDDWEVDGRDDNAQLDGSMDLIFVSRERFAARGHNPEVFPRDAYEHYDSAVPTSEPTRLATLLGKDQLFLVDAGLLMAHVPVEVLAPHGADIWAAATEAQLVVINGLGGEIATEPHDLRVDVEDIPAVGALNDTFKGLIALVKASHTFPQLHKGGVGSGTGQGWWAQNDEWVGAVSVGRDRGRDCVATNTALVPREVWDTHARDRFGDPGFETFGWGIEPVSRQTERNFTQIHFASQRAVNRRVETARQQLSTWLNVWTATTKEAPQAG